MEHCCETSAHKIQTPGNRPKARIQHLQRGKIWKSRIVTTCIGCQNSCICVDFFILVFGFLQAASQPRSSYRRTGISEVRLIQNNFTKTAVLNKLKQVFPFVCIIRFHYAYLVLR
jgi:hypothetical protein